MRLLSWRRLRGILFKSALFKDLRTLCRKLNFTSTQSKRQPCRSSALNVRRTLRLARVRRDWRPVKKSNWFNNDADVRPKRFPSLAFPVCIVPSLVTCSLVTSPLPITHHPSHFHPSYLSGFSSWRTIWETTCVWTKDPTLTMFPSCTSVMAWHRRSVASLTLYWLSCLQMGDS